MLTKMIEALWLVVASFGYTDVEIPVQTGNTTDRVLWTKVIFPEDLSENQSCLSTEEHVQFLVSAFLAGFLFFNIGHQILGDREQWVEDCLNERNEEMYKWAMNERFEDMNPHEGVKRYTKKDMRKIRRRLKKTGEKRQEAWDESPEFVVPDRFYEKFASKFKIPKKGLLGTAKCMLLMERKYQKIPMTWIRFKDALLKKDKAAAAAFAAESNSDVALSSAAAAAAAAVRAAVGASKDPGKPGSLVSGLLGAGTTTARAFAKIGTGTTNMVSKFGVNATETIVGKAAAKTIGDAAATSISAVAKGAGRVASLSFDMAESAADIVKSPRKSIAVVAAGVRHGLGIQSARDRENHGIPEMILEGAAHENDEENDDQDKEYESSANESRTADDFQEDNVDADDESDDGFVDIV